MECAGEKFGFGTSCDAAYHYSKFILADGNCFAEGDEVVYLSDSSTTFFKKGTVREVKCNRKYYLDKDPGIQVDAQYMGYKLKARAAAPVHGQ